MKKSISLLALLFVFFALPASANFYDVDRVFCHKENGVEEFDATDGMRVFFNGDAGVFGLGETTLVDGFECRKVDFSNVVTGKAFTDATSGIFVYQFDRIAGFKTRSTCDPKESEFDGKTFSAGLITNSTVLLADTPLCKILELRLVQP